MLCVPLHVMKRLAPPTASDRSAPWLGLTIVSFRAAMKRHGHRMCLARSIGATVLRSHLVLFLTLRRSIPSAPFTRKPGTFTCFKVVPGRAGFSVNERVK